MPNLCKSTFSTCRRFAAAAEQVEGRQVAGALLGQAMMAAVGRLDEQLRFLDKMSHAIDVERGVLVGMTVQQVQGELAAGVLARVRTLEQLGVVEALLELGDDLFGIIGDIAHLGAYQSLRGDQHRLISGRIGLREVILLEVYLGLEVALLGGLQVELDLQHDFAVAHSARWCDVRDREFARVAPGVE